MKKIPPLLLSLLSGVLLFASWPVSPCTFFIFIAFVPMLLVADRVRHRGRFFGWILLSLLVWNAGTTWWTCNSTVPGGIAAIVANSLLMSIPWIGFFNIKKRMGDRAGYLSFVLFWLVFEFIHLNWELSWPWLTVGNVFATHPGWVQWYEYSGVGGGSLWVLLINLFIFLFIRERSKKIKVYDRWYLLILLFLVVIPFSFSFFIGSEHRGAAQTPASGSQANIVVVQPDIDPWDEKHVAGSEEMQLQKLIGLTVSQVDSATVLVIWPETAIPVSMNEDSLKHNYFLAPVWEFLAHHPKINLLTGEEGFQFLDEQHKTVNSFRIPGTNHYANSYNSALLMDSSRYQTYHKSKLVPGVEIVPSFLHFMDSWFEKFGGATGSYTKQEARTVLFCYNHSYAIAPAICYESIYGEFMSKYVKNGATIIAVITNDGWWGNTAGYKQHESYGRLRAIETRRWVVRSANTGISCFIAPNGEVLDAQPWDKAVAIKMAVPVSHELTWYVRLGDLIFEAASIGAICLLVWNLIVVIKSKRRFGQNNSI